MPGLTTIALFALIICYKIRSIYNQDSLTPRGDAVQKTARANSPSCHVSVLQIFRITHRTVDVCQASVQQFAAKALKHSPADARPQQRQRPTGRTRPQTATQTRPGAARGPSGDATDQRRPQTPALQRRACRTQPVSASRCSSTCPRS